MSAPMCWLAPPDAPPCVNPVQWRLIATLRAPKTPDKLVPFGHSCGPHLAGQTQSSILMQHFDLLACLLPEPKPDGTIATFGFLPVDMETTYAAG